jgi:hypothetical protein
MNSVLTRGLTPGHRTGSADRCIVAACAPAGQLLVGCELLDPVCVGTRLSPGRAMGVSVPEAIAECRGVLLDPQQRVFYDAVILSF